MKQGQPRFRNQEKKKKIPTPNKKKAKKEKKSAPKGYESRHRIKAKTYRINMDSDSIFGHNQ